MSKTYGYVRVSTDEQTSNSQRDAIIARFPTASILADDGISGTVPPRERPALGILLNQLLQEGDTLVIYAIDRIGRNARDTLELVEELVLRGGGVGVFTGCAAGDSGVACVLRVTDSHAQ